jgi:hypothetical protein
VQYDIDDDHESAATAEMMASIHKLEASIDKFD